MTEKINLDCKYYNGDIPCIFHKKYGVHCSDCQYYETYNKKILIIKLGAIGDVIRTTPLLHKLKTRYPHSQIHWITHSPEVLPGYFIDRIHKYKFNTCEILKNSEFDISINLDKDREACALQNQINAKKKFGFKLLHGNCHPIDKKAVAKWLTGLFDDLNLKNPESYVQEIFKICGFDFKGEEYIIAHKDRKKFSLPKNKTIIGLNTGCGKRWTTRLWPEDHWIKLAQLLKKKGFFVLLLGGKQENDKNKRIAGSASVEYLGHFSLLEFIDLMNQCNIIVTAVTMSLHIALALKKKIILFNNIFNPHEFELYGRGTIIEPPVDCKGCFKNTCEKPCMELIKPEQVLEEITRLNED
ncbi:MAG: glycosyltransferase family 9 protein [bacterium]